MSMHICNITKYQMALAVLRPKEVFKYPSIKAFVVRGVSIEDILQTTVSSDAGIQTSLRIFENYGVCLHGRVGVDISRFCADVFYRRRPKILILVKAKGHFFTCCKKRVCAETPIVRGRP